MMSVHPRQLAIFRCYAELNDFLPSIRRFVPFGHYFEVHASVKDMIESMGVPHTEVDLILLNGMPVDFSHKLQDGDRVSVYPAFRSLDISPLLQLRTPLQELQFVLDTHLGRLATYLRMLGFDASYETNREDKELSRISHHEHRILLTRDCGLLKRGEVVHGYFVRGTEPREQVVEVLGRFDLFPVISPFRRCLRCNTLLNPVAKETIIERLQPKTRQFYDEFRICPACNRIYWAGSHHEHMQRFVQRILARSAPR
jgi:uncharacterized protein with PIN domain/sulfur carrier protein ThiS